MKRTIILKSFPLLVLVSGLVITLVTSAQNSTASSAKQTMDTIPKKQKQVRDLDEALLELDRSEIELSKALKEIDCDKIEKEIRQAMKHMDVDMAKAKEEMAKAMKEIDWQKIDVDVQKALTEAQKTMKEVDFEKIQKDVQASLAKVDMKKINAEMEEVRKELEEIRPEIKRSMAEAKKEMEKARKEITAYKNLVSALEKDGHLEKGEDYKIEYKNKELVVNGKKLTTDETKKYSEFLSGVKDFTLQKDDDNFNIHHK